MCGKIWEPYDCSSPLFTGFSCTEFGCVKLGRMLSVGGVVWSFHFLWELFLFAIIYTIFKKNKIIGENTNLFVV